jgi:hypothetical protein
VSVAYEYDYEPSARDRVYDAGREQGDARDYEPESLRARNASRQLQTEMVSYAEVRAWGVWLNVFTPSDLANAMGVDFSVGVKGCRAMEWHGIIENTGDEVPGPEGMEPIYSYVPLPPGPKEHLTLLPPEKDWRIGCYTEILSPRGMPVRIRTGREYRRQLAGSQSGRRKLLESDARFKAIEEANAKRAEEQRVKAQRARDIGNAHKYKKEQQ